MTDPFFAHDGLTLYQGDAVEGLASLAAESADCVVTSPPYLDARPEVPAPSPDEWAAIFAALRRAVRGLALFNVGRIWRGHCEQLWWVDLLRIAEGEGWSLLDTLVWIKPNGNPIQGELFANRHEYVLVLGRPGEALNTDAIRVPYASSSISRMTRNWTNHTGVKNDEGRRVGRRESEPHPLGGRPPSYVTINTGGEKGNPHPTPMPLELAEHLVLAASWPDQIVLDPFCGSGTTLRAARKLGRHAIGIELNPLYCEMTARRLQVPEAVERAAKTATEPTQLVIG